MNFFQHQEKARRNTKLLVGLFTLAVVLIGLSIYMAAQFAFHGAMIKEAANAGEPVPPMTLWNPELFLMVMIGTVGFIGLASLYRTAKLRSGGGSVATMLGGRLVDPGTRDRVERRLVNVVEEMAIASGVPVPEIYIMDNEAGINAFAAGFTPDNAAIAVTRGILDRLNREELQGVIAHEFSHIINGDMRLNIRLIGVLFGILAITVIGRFLLYSGAMSRRSRDNTIPMLAGITLLVVGYIGVFIGRLIQSAVSRQREFLADSSAVQFTRNPNGIAGALKKIAGYDAGSYLKSPESTEVGHLLFGAGEKVRFMAAMRSTHPPIEERIRRIDPSFKPEEPAEQSSDIVPDSASPLTAGFGGTTVHANADSVVDRVGNVGERELALSARLVSSLPEDLHTALETTQSATQVVYALLLDRDEAERTKQLEILKGMCGDETATGSGEFFRQVADYDQQARLPLADLAMPALRKMAPEDAGTFLVVVDALVAADGKVTLFEFALQWLLTHRLRRKGRGRVIYKSMERVAWNVAQLVASLARAGNPGDREAMAHAFQEGMAKVKTRKSGAILHAFQDDRLGSLTDVGQALDRLSLSSYRIRERVIDAAAHCVLADQVVTTEEAELLRLVAISLDCPVPPFVADQM